MIALVPNGCKIKSAKPELVELLRSRAGVASDGYALQPPQELVEARARLLQHVADTELSIEAIVQPRQGQPSPDTGFATPGSTPTMLDDITIDSPRTLEPDGVEVQPPPLTRHVCRPTANHWTTSPTSSSLISLDANSLGHEPVQTAGSISLRAHGHTSAVAAARGHAAFLASGHCAVVERALAVASGARVRQRT